MAKLIDKKTTTKATKTVKPVKKAVKVEKVAKVVKAIKATKEVNAVKVAKVKIEKKPEVKKVQRVGLTIDVVNPEGEVKGKIELDKELFGSVVNDGLMSQAVRVYLANQRFGGAQAKTRGEVEGSSRKIYRQKGSGKARHGSIRAPIFVGGGAVFGPRTHDYSLKLPQKMKQKALESALSHQNKADNIIVVDGLDELEPKTKLMAKSFMTIAGDSKILFVVDTTKNTCLKAVRNLKKIDLISATSLNTYVVLSHEKLVFTKDAMNLLSKETSK
jgi:large subunit ribosomal protein L4